MISLGIFLNSLKFRKFYPTRPERAEALSPGQRPGLFGAVTCRPVRAKALKLQTKHKAFALTGRLADCYYTQGAALGYELLGLQPVLKLHAKVQLNSQILDNKSESEDLFLREALDRRNLLEALHVEVFLVAEDDHAVRLAHDVLLLEVSDVLKCHVLERLIELLVGIVVESLQLGIEVSVEHIVLSGTHTLQALDEALLSQVECRIFSARGMS